jgi:GT2 family glycosyltransferase
MTPQLSIVTVLYGGIDVLRETLPSWSTSVEGLDVEFVVVDNSPNASPTELVSEVLQDTRLQIISRPSNPGFAASANEGISRASSDHVLLLNADVFLTPDAVREAMLLSENRLPVAFPLRTEGKVLCGVELTWFGFVVDHIHSGKLPVIGPSGGAALIWKNLFDDLGGFDEDLFAWGEDGSFALRLRAAGLHTLVATSVLDHVGGHSVASLEGQRFKARLLARNRVIVFRRDLSIGLRILICVPFLAAMILNGVVSKSRSRTARAYFGGLARGLGVRLAEDRSIRFGIADWRNCSIPRSSTGPAGIAPNSGGG